MAEAKTRELLNAEANVRLIAPAVTDQIGAWSQEQKLDWEARSHEHGDLKDAFLVVSVSDAETNPKSLKTQKRDMSSVTQWTISSTAKPDLDCFTNRPAHALLEHFALHTKARALLTIPFALKGRRSPLVEGSAQSPTRTSPPERSLQPLPQSAHTGKA